MPITPSITKTVNSSRITISIGKLKGNSLEAKTNKKKDRSSKTKRLKSRLRLTNKSKREIKKKIEEITNKLNGKDP